MKYGIEMLFKYVKEDEACIEIFEKHLPGMLERLGANPMVDNLSIQKLAQYAQGAISDEILQTMDTELAKLGEGEKKLTASELEKIQRYQSIAQKMQEVKLADGTDDGRQKKQTAIYPGRPWMDTNGKRIQAHAGAIYFENDTYYWYGENKEHTDGVCDIWTWGIRAYASRDLYNWEDLGLIIEPVLDNPDSNLFPDKRVDRPHILKCDKTGKYVCWIKLSGEEACFLILSSDSLLGPYQVEKENYYPFGNKVGDFDLVKDEETGKAYLFFDADHAGIVGAELTDDFFAVECEVSRQYTGLHAPFCREGVTLFERDGKKYMLTSGMTGYIPNKSDSAMADEWTSEFESTGNPHVNDDTNASFNSQMSQVFKVQGKKDLYIAIADRWVPEYMLDAERVDLIERGIASHYEPEKYPMTEEEKQELLNSPMLESANTSIADYVWLPLHFDGENVQIAWREEWRLEDFE